ncbi:MAG TPA: nucleoside hydrolase [Acidimicrobiales bacterium]|nr:nucleoside hydrolase [Acidimicrobiales bacterium]|tara:strand:- start:2262 stop:3191 length:930 start_codon:yes stop_codon:yes gene_type:complete
MTDKPRIILDCDPGIDDAFAIVTASRWAEIIAVTTVSGNVSLDKTTANALRLRSLIGSDFPVHAGAHKPLEVAPLSAGHVHGDCGLGGIDLPYSSESPDSNNAIEFLVEETRKEEGLHLVPIGPLTNIALALQADPDMAKRVSSITFMGGSAGGLGNVTAAAEFNIYADPEAAQVVLQSGSPVSMVGLNLTHQVQVGTKETEICHSIDTPVGSAMAYLLDFYADFYRSHLGTDTGSMHDPCAVLAITHPELFAFEEKYVAVEVNGQHTRGMTLVDERGVGSEFEPNCRVAYNVNAQEAVALIMQAVAEV